MQAQLTQVGHLSVSSLIVQVSCIKSKSNLKRHENPIRSMPTSVVVSTKTEDGYTHVFVAVDTYSKYCFLYALKGFKTDEIADSIQEIIFLVGTSTRIITDNGISLRADQKQSFD